MAKKSQVNVKMLQLYNLDRFSNRNMVRNTPSRINLLKVNNRNTRTRCDIWPMFTIKTTQYDASGVFLVPLLLTLNIFHILF